jgi:hypothetical protein
MMSPERQRTVVKVLVVVVGLSMVVSLVVPYLYR